MDRTNSKLLADLRKKVAKPGDPPVSLQAIQQPRAKLQDVVSMPTDIASYIVAQRAGMKLHSYLDESKLDQVATWEQRLSAKQAASAEVSPVESKGSPVTKSTIVKEFHLDKVKIPDGVVRWPKGRGRKDGRRLPVAVCLRELGARVRGRSPHGGVRQRLVG
jgi:hypothetical protein